MFKTTSLALTIAVAVASLGSSPEAQAGERGRRIAGGILQGIGQAISNNQQGGYIPQPNYYPPQGGYIPQPPYNPVVGSTTQGFQTFNPNLNQWNQHVNHQQFHQSAYDPNRNFVAPGSQMQTQQFWVDQNGNRFQRDHTQWNSSTTGRQHGRDTVRKTDTQGNTSTSTGFYLDGGSSKGRSRRR